MFAKINIENGTDTHTHRFETNVFQFVALIAALFKSHADISFGLADTSNPFTLH